MRIVDIHEAEKHLSKLIDEAVKGEPFIIAKAGKPLVRVTAVEAAATRQRLGFLVGHISVPDDFHTMGEAEMDNLFEGES
jgi:prevent-host-death family protein